LKEYNSINRVNVIVLIDI